MIIKLNNYLIRPARYIPKIIYLARSPFKNIISANFSLLIDKIKDIFTYLKINYNISIIFINLFMLSECKSATIEFIAPQVGIDKS